MLLINKSVFVSLFFFSLTACAIPPDVEDVTGVDTYEIVRRVRCEMRDAIRELARSAIARRDERLAATLATDKDFLKFEFASLGSDSKEIIGLYKDTLIGYDFSFDITENNSASANTSVLHNFARGTLGINVGAINDRERNNIETFRTIDSFQKLSLGVGNDYCWGSIPSKPNYTYPITGGLELKRYVKKFLDLNQSGNLSDAVGGDDISKYTVSLKFTTLLSAGISSDLDLPSRVRSWEIIGLDASVNNVRKDIHQVSIVFLLPAGGDKRAATIAEARVKDELDYIRTRDDLRHFGRR